MSLSKGKLNTDIEWLSYCYFTPYKIRTIIISLDFGAFNETVFLPPKFRTSAMYEHGTAISGVMFITNLYDTLDQALVLTGSRVDIMIPYV
jgi:hypothetical protein